MDSIKKSLNFGFTTGTSFSSPLVTGVFLLVEAVLRISKVFKGLPGIEKNKIRKNIITASQRNGVVNANLAVHTAKYWLDHGNGKPIAPKAIAEQVKKSENKKCNTRARRIVRGRICNLIPNKKCEKKKACYERKQALADLCTPPAQSVLEDLFRTAVDGKNDEIALGWMARWTAQDPTVEIPLADVLLDRYRRNWARTRRGRFRLDTQRWLSHSQKNDCYRSRTRPFGESDRKRHRQSFAEGAFFKRT